MGRVSDLARVGDPGSPGLRLGFLSLKDPGSVSHVIHLIALFSQTPEPGGVRTLTLNPTAYSQ